MKINVSSASIISNPCLTPLYYAALADGVIRCVPGEDHTNGFFVSCFIKKQALPAGQGQKRKLAQAADTTEEPIREEDNEKQGSPVEGEGVPEESGGKVSSSKKKKKNKRKKQKKGSVSTTVNS